MAFVSLTKFVVFHTDVNLLLNKYLSTCSIAYFHVKPLSVKTKSSKPARFQNNSRDTSLHRPSSQEIDLMSLGIDINKLSVAEDEDNYADGFGDEEYDFALEQGDKLYDMYEREKYYHMKTVRKKIIERKYFKKPPEVCLLTYAAKQQIRYLHELNPDEWNPKSICESFPISENGVRKLLKNHGYASSERIHRNDQIVAQNWKQLMEGKDISLCLSLKERFMAGKLTPLSAAGNPSLPLPPKKEQVVVNVRRKKTGQFLALVKPYLDMQKRAVLANEKLEQTDSNSNENAEKTVNFHTPHDDQMEWDDMKQLSKKSRSSVPISVQQFEENMKRWLAKKRSKTEMDKMILDWLENKKQKENVQRTSSECDISKVFRKVQKYKNEHEINLKVDVNQSEGHKVSYLYDTKYGYQHPFGKSDPSPENIQIPRELYKDGKVYRVGSSYYNDKGEFLYKVPLSFSEEEP